MCVYLSTSLHEQNMIQGQLFKWSLTGLNSRVPSILVGMPRLKSSVCHAIYTLAGWRIVGCILFPRVGVLWEMQTALSRISTWIVVSISYDDNHYTMCASYLLFICISSSSSFIFFIHHNHPSLWISPTDYISCLYSAVVGKFLLLGQH